MHPEPRPVFPRAIVDRLDRAIEVRIETHGSPGEPHWMIIWVVVDAGEVFIRSYRGAGARWYREAIGGGEVALLIDGDRIPVRASRATDAADIARCSDALESKYAGDPATPDMLREEVLDTTLRLDPA